VTSIVGLTRQEFPEQPDPRKPTLPKGRHWLWLTHDLRDCSMKAIDLILGMGPAAPSGSGLEIWDAITVEQVDKDSYQVTLFEKSYKLEYEEYIFVSKLKELKGSAIAIAKIPGLERSKPSRILKGLPREIAKYIECKPGAGCWFKRIGSRIS
jgi:hypothetical protein